MKTMNIARLLMVFLLTSLHVNAQSELKTQSISVFKNGSAFFVKKGQVDVQKGAYFLEGEVPKAAIGTLWFSASNGGIDRVKMHTLSTQKVQKRTAEFKSSAFGPMLEANFQKKLTLFLQDDISLTGTVEKIDNDYLLFKTGSKWINLRTTSVKRIEFLSKPNLPDSTSVWNDTIIDSKEGLMIDFTSKHASQELGMMYLQKGIGWVPTYNIDLVSEEKARIRLHAVVSNYAEDFVDSDLNFVVGVPNFLQQDNISPLSKHGLKSVNQFYNSITSGGGSGVTDFANRGGRIAYGINTRSDFSSGSQIGLEGFSSEDLFFYNLPKVSMKYGESTQFSILQAEIGVSHIYEVQLEGNTSEYSYYQNLGVRNKFSFEENFKNKVWHSIKLTNSTSSPWTGGAVMVTNSEDGIPRPISQDKITYTPSGAETFLKLTVAPEVNVRDVEKEKNVEERSIEIDGYWYDNVHVEGEIMVRNYKSKKIDLNVRKKIVGELEDSNVNWLKSKQIKNRHQKNQVTNVCWELSLKPGEKRTVKYSYSVLIRR